jgi:hypothetical protein
MLRWMMQCLRMTNWKGNGICLFQITLTEARKASRWSVCGPDFELWRFPCTDCKLQPFCREVWGCSESRNLAELQDTASLTLLPCAAIVYSVDCILSTTVRHTALSYMNAALTSGSSATVLHLRHSRSLFSQGPILLTVWHQSIAIYELNEQLLVNACKLTTTNTECSKSHATRNKIFIDDCCSVHFDRINKHSILLSVYKSPRRPRHVLTCSQSVSFLKTVEEQECIFHKCGERS